MVQPQYLPKPNHDIPIYERLQSYYESLIPNGTAVEKTKKIAKAVLFGLIGTAMFVSNPTLFSLSFIGGLIWDTNTAEVVEKMKNIWERQPGHVLYLAGIASFLALQVTWAAGSVLFAANLGSQMAQNPQ